MGTYTDVCRVASAAEIKCLLTTSLKTAQDKCPIVLNLSYQIIIGQFCIYEKQPKFASLLYCPVTNCAFPLHHQGVSRY